MIEKFFAADAKGDIASLKSDFKAAEKEGKATYAEHKDEVAAQGEATKSTLAALTADLNAGKITQAELEQKLAEMTD